MSNKQRKATTSNQSTSPLLIAFLSAVSTIAFYAFADWTPVGGEFLRRYFCSHPLEYVSTAMFFTGLSLLFLKYCRLGADRAAFGQAATLTLTDEMASADQMELESGLQQWSDELAPRVRNSQLLQRIQETLHYLRGSSREGLEDHLRYLAELASERLHQSFATVRTITWAIPILGFLGTVIGITMAIANVTPEQLDTSLGEVTQGLSVAFDTTALALGMSIVLVFCSFAVEQKQQKILGDVEQFGIETLLPWFSIPAGLTSHSPQSTVSDDAPAISGRIWEQQLSELKSVWAELLTDHSIKITDALNTETQQTLKYHRDSAEDARDAYSAALKQSAQTVVKQTDRLLNSFEQRVSNWQEAVLVSSQSSTQQAEALHELGATMLRMAESEERLAALQKQLNDNLQALQLADTMEQTASSLTAAVHVLTAKTSPRAAA